MGEVEAQATHVVPHGQTCYDAPRFAAAIKHRHSQVPRYWGIQCKLNNSHSDESRCRLTFLRPWLRFFDDVVFGRFLIYLSERCYYVLTT